MALESHVLTALGLLSARDPLPVLAAQSPRHRRGTCESWAGDPWEMHLFYFILAPNKEGLGMEVIKTPQSFHAPAQRLKPPR